MFAMDSMSNLADLWLLRHLVSLTYIILLSFAVYTPGLFTLEDASKYASRPILLTTNNTKQMRATRIGRDRAGLPVEKKSIAHSYERDDNHKT